MLKAVLLLAIPLLLLVTIALPQERIVTKQDFDSVVEQEKSRLGIDAVIQTRFDLQDSGAYSFRLGDEYYIVLGKENTVSAVKHEMYHVYSMVHDRKNFLDEPLASLYEQTGIRL